MLCFYGNSTATLQLSFIQSVTCIQFYRMNAQFCVCVSASMCTWARVQRIQLIGNSNIMPIILFSFYKCHSHSGRHVANVLVRLLARKGSKYVLSQFDAWNKKKCFVNIATMWTVYQGTKQDIVEFDNCCRYMATMNAR